ncbi:hypothetical protein Enr13x_66320 [Stieleria neptunia]|uniref:Polymer-forming cytoskeletal n=1 Tax=Stieleria neptunia TaxID=2527979 RepID=A0A518I0W0_9BACT|nr:hypothetical protein Enr13x_66320 [Stieleria neptunia]
MVFPSSISYWRFNGESEKRWGERSSQTEPVLIGSGDALALNADSDALISAPDGGIVHINGDLNSGLEIGGHHEVILCGDVAKGATINASGFHHIFIGGSVYGKIAVSGSSKIWIDGDFSGALITGTPSTHVHVLGNFAADVSPMERPALLWLAVGGFAENDLMVSVASVGYTQFNATVGRSDVPAGLYPDGPTRRKTERGNSFSRWCILSTSARVIRHNFQVMACRLPHRFRIASSSAFVTRF